LIDAFRNPLASGTCAQSEPSDAAGGVTAGAGVDPAGTGLGPAPDVGVVTRADDAVARMAADGSLAPCDKPRLGLGVVGAGVAGVLAHAARRTPRRREAVPRFAFICRRRWC
jgi:hypothetical protein